MAQQLRNEELDNQQLLLASPQIKPSYSASGRLGALCLRQLTAGYFALSRGAPSNTPATHHAFEITPNASSRCSSLRWRLALTHKAMILSRSLLPSCLHGRFPAVVHDGGGVLPFVMNGNMSPFTFPKKSTDKRFDNPLGRADVIWHDTIP